MRPALVELELPAKITPSSQTSLYGRPEGSQEVFPRTSIVTAVVSAVTFDAVAHRAAVVDHGLVFDGKIRPVEDYGGLGVCSINLSQSCPGRQPNESVRGSLQIALSISLINTVLGKPVSWLSRQKHRGQLVRVHILTDCEVVKTTAKHKNSRKATKDLWFLIEAVSRGGLELTFHWMERDSTQLNQFADAVAGLTRKQLLCDMKQQGLEKLCDDITSIYDLNPGE